MIFIINKEGTTKAAVHEKIYQGSNNVNRIILLAPISSTAVATVSFVLPNGQVMEPYYMTPYGDIGGNVVDKDGNCFNAWSMLINYPITQYAGKVEVQFAFNLGDNEKLTVQKTCFEVIYREAVDLPEEPTKNIYDQILSHLSSIKGKSDQALSTAIKSIRFISPDDLITPDSVEIYPSTLVGDGDDPDYKGSFSVSGMTEHIESTDGEELFLAFRNTSNISQDIGFTIDLGEEKQVGFVQLTGWANYLSTKLIILTSVNGTEFTQKGEIILPPVTNGAQDVYRFNLKGENARFIRIVQPLQGGGMAYRFNFRSVEVFAPTYKGNYKITHNNGVVNYIDIFNGELLYNQVNSLKNQAEEYASYVKEQFNKEGKIGGVILLEDVNGEAKIPSVYIQQIDIKDYVEITDEASLDTIDVQKGDVAVLASEVNGEKTITKSWILLGVNDDGTRNWAVYGTSYATNAGNATYALSSGNTTHINGNIINKVTQAEYDSLTDKTGIYFVTTGE